MSIDGERVRDRRTEGPPCTAASRGDHARMKWNKSPLDAALVKEMARRYEIDLLAASILARRGVTTPDAVRFFLQDDLRGLHNPFLMSAMTEGVERINAAVDS